MSDNTSDQPRVEALLDLVELRRPVAESAAALAEFAWDSDRELVGLSRADARRVLGAYQERRLSADDCQRWAEALEGRDDVGLEPGYEDRLKDFLFTLATPELTEPLTPALAEHWLAVLAA